jgi:hypothetical protein
LNKSTTLENPTNIDEIIFKEIIKLLEKIRIRKGGVRLVGIKLSKLTSNHAIRQLTLLGEKEDKLEIMDDMIRYFTIRGELKRVEEIREYKRINYGVTQEREW